ncbi:hypothetical protein KFU94_13265 [Chloroflexi bacterium TSY]|nr:hypothetical protein [Chloroflexi bacterium TSY]
MKHLLIVMLLIFVGAAGWRVGENLSSDATGMAIGMLLGIMAGIPTALLVLASGRRHQYERKNESRTRRQQLQIPQEYQTSQPPVIVVTGTGQSPQPQIGPYIPPNYPPQYEGEWTLPQPTVRQRQFTVVGGEELEE